MANVCRTEIYIHANQSTIDWFEKLVKNFFVEDFIGQFGSDADNNADKIGCRWLLKYDEFREDAHTYFISFESAWYPPDILMKNMYAQVAALDKGAYLDGRYWDETFDPIGKFEINETGYHTVESAVEADMDSDYFWDDYVQPAFDNLEL
jgi:hypothetical protein